MNSRKYVKPEVKKLGPIESMADTNSPNQMDDAPGSKQIGNGPNPNPDEPDGPQSTL